VIHLSGAVVVDESTELTDVWLQDGRIRFDQPTAPVDRQLDGVVLPGLADVHCHIGLSPEGGTNRELARAQAITNRNAGVLLIRDAGVPEAAVSSSWMDQDPAMPRLIRCGRHIARTKRYIPGFGVDVVPEDLPEAAATQARAGDGWIKLVGDWIDRTLDPPDLAPLWPDQALASAVQRVHALGARVTIHVFSHQGAAQALRCQVDCIEHGFGMDQALMAQAARQGVAVVPTMLQRGNLDQIAQAGREKFPVWAAHHQALFEARFTQALGLYQAGVQLLLGTDPSRGIRHGQVAAEAALMVKAGIPAAEVVKVASWGTRSYLGAQSIDDGAPADLVVYRADPREDITQLASPQAVILRGVQVA